MFPFICWNLIQKQSASKESTFSIKTESQSCLSERLYALAPSMTDIANKWHDNPNSRLSGEAEREVLNILQEMSIIGKNICRGGGYKLCRRNEIHALIRSYSTPVLFITLNPHDILSFLVGVQGNVDEATWREMTHHQWAVFIAEHPDAAAKAFDIQIRTFLDVVVRYRKSGGGLFGTCEAYYGMVEVQGRGTLHCHLLLWLRGNPSPQVLRDKWSWTNGLAWTLVIGWKTS